MRWAKSTGNSTAIDLLVEYGAPPSSPALSRRTSLMSQSSSRSNQRQTEIDTNPSKCEYAKVLPPKIDVVSSSIKTLVEDVVTPIDSIPKELTKSTSSADMSSKSSSSTVNTESTILPEDNSPFDWSASPPRKQDMYPFEIDHIGHILNVTIRTIVPKRSKKFAPLGANVLFLCARYAVYRQSPDLGNGFLKSSIGAIKLWLRSNEEMGVQMYWLSNSLQLLIYILRDKVMSKSMKAVQKELRVLCADILVDIYSQIELEVDSMTVSAIIDHQANESKLEMDFFGFAKRTSRFKKMDYLQSLSQLGSYLPTATKSTPADLFEMFANILAMCKANLIHSSLKLQLFTRIFAKITKILFLKITCTRNLCCRSRAQQIQMNLSLITDWIHEHASSFESIQPLLKQFFPLRQLLQFIQVVSTTRQVSDFKNVMEMFELSNKCVYIVMANYRYESGEQSFPAVVESYVISLLDETENVWNEQDVDFKVSMERDESEYWSVDPSVPPLVKEMIDAGTRYLPRKVSKLEQSDPSRNSPPLVIMEAVGE